MPVTGPVSCDEKAYAAWQARREQEWEKTCSGCGACCGVVEGDPCEHLEEKGEGRYVCRIYDHRFGLHRTRSGKPFRCVPIRNVLHLSWPGDHLCTYKTNNCPVQP